MIELWIVIGALALAALSRWAIRMRDRYDKAREHGYRWVSGWQSNYQEKPFSDSEFDAFVKVIEEGPEK